jgi:hypothetical protein
MLAQPRPDPDHRQEQCQLGPEGGQAQHRRARRDQAGGVDRLCAPPPDDRHHRERRDERDEVVEAADLPVDEDASRKPVLPESAVP